MVTSFSAKTQAKFERAAPENAMLLSESPRDSRRLHFARRWSHGE